MIQKLIRTISKSTIGTSATASIIAEEGRVTLGKCLKYKLRTKKLNKKFKQSKIIQKLIRTISKLTLGTSATASIIAEEGRVTLRKYLKYRLRTKKLKKEIKQSKIYWEQSHNFKLKNVSPVTSPLVLISQIQRSGGSLLSQLFDGHPEVHPHPHELMLGYKKKHVWPRIDLKENPKRWFHILFENMVIKHTIEGYKKGRKDKESFSFIFSPYLQNKIFLEYIDSVKPLSLRTVLDAYMTSYFGAWLNNRNYNGKKKLVTAFTPRLSMKQENMDIFFEVYPDGRLISLIRDPKNWFPSALRHSPKFYGDIKLAILQWNESAQAMLRNKELYGDRIRLLKFEDLVGDTEAVMRYLSKFLDIEFEDILVVPTFNKSSIKAHTSFKVENHGILKGTKLRYKTLTESELDTIEEMTADIYSRALKEVVKF